MRVCLLTVLIGFPLLAVGGEEVPPQAGAASAEIEFFEKQVRPLLAKHCFECHSSETGADNGELVLETPAGIAAGGSRGPLVVGADLESSLLWEAVRFDDVALQMPPEGKLKQDELDVLAEWIRLGTPLPEYADEPRPAGQKIDVDAGREFWAFQPLMHVETPDVGTGDTVRQPLDAFILKRLREEGLDPSPKADRRTLIRRVTFDLTGLPPRPDEVEAFLADDSPDAYERLVDRWLDSPRFGEHWGRFWLDLARYSDVLPSWQSGNGKSWPYRDWVVEAFNLNVPFDRFVRMQLAADLMPDVEPADHAALGFLGLSPMYWKELKLAPEVIEVIVADEWEERVDAVTRTFLGQTVACARCHDHKFDPFTMQDYYALAGVFASSQSVDRPLLPQEQAETVIEAHRQVEKLQTQIKQLDGKIKQFASRIKTLEKEDDADASELQEIREQKADHEARIKELNERIAAIERETSDYDAPWALVMREASLYVKPQGEDRTRLEYVEAEPRDLPLFRRGNPSNPGPIVPRRFLEVLSSGEPATFTEGSGRSELADALFEESPHLTARVFVNRVWGQLFGIGLVRTPSDFGRQGEPPSHPELLDFLAAEFIADGWDVKRLVRRMVLSATYRQAVHSNGKANELDPENRLLWRMNRKRLTVEMWRDAMLVVAGTLDPTLGGLEVSLDAADNRRRTLYASVSRRDLNSTLRMFDFPDPNSHSPQRVPTTTSLQQLYVLNAPFVRRQAEAIALRLSGDSVEARIAHGYRLLFGREPFSDELAAGREFLQPTPDDEPTENRWRDYVHALLGLNEFIYLD
jgi:hypothetical protein